MQTMEFAKKEGWFIKSYALGVVLTLDGTKTIQTECRHFKQAVLDYVHQRGRHCRAVTLTVVSPASTHDYIREFMSLVVNQESQLAPIFQNRSFSLELVA